MNLLEKLREPYARDCFKHELAPDPVAFADEHINAMTNVELIIALGCVLEEILADAATAKALDS